MIRSASAKPRSMSPRVDHDRRQHQVAAGPTVVNGRGAGAQRVLDGEHRGQLLVLDVDQVERLLGDLFARRGDGGDALAPVAHLAVEDVLVAGHRGRARMRRAGMQHARHVFVASAPP